MPPFLSDLHIDSAFATYCHNVLRCVQVSAKDEYVVDLMRAKYSTFVMPTIGQKEFASGKYFEVRDANNVPYALLQIDHSLLKSNLLKKCDCALVDDKEISFVEFKADATNTTTKGFKNNTNKALTQLENTIAMFRTQLSSIGLELDSLRTIDAYVCFYQGYPRHSAAEMNYCVDFALSTGCSLSFEQYKEIHV